ncbi:MAG TPA: ABC transporter substrate-binding protein [Thermodesulfovibrionales bacterium]|nr:ABC transporter substrate-binding protein [Thermodesulfovibrionales bacterium]
MRTDGMTFGFLVLFCLSLLLSAPSKANAGEPTDQVKQTVDAVLDILRNKELKRPEKTEERRAKIRNIVSGRFDFEEMARRSLAQNWKKRTPQEQKEFVALYTDLLENTYIKKIERYQDEKVAYRDEKTEGPYATVKTSIITSKEVDIPIEYRLLKKGNLWMAYDVVIEGVSLVNNYRNQFNEIIRSQSYEELVKRMKSKSLKEPTS